MRQWLLHAHFSERNGSDESKFTRDYDSRNAESVIPVLCNTLNFSTLSVLGAGAYDEEKICHKRPAFSPYIIYLLNAVNI